MLSGIQHYVFCRRQWALIHIEQQWAENYRTVDGNILHDHVHDPVFHEKRGDTVLSRGMQVFSAKLGISGTCDAVEFKASPQGVWIPRLNGTYLVIPVEYKRGSVKCNDCDALQLAAQALCLEEMLGCSVPYGYLYYGETRHRHQVLLDASIRTRTEQVFQQMHQLYEQRHTPKVKPTKACNACSLKDICLPGLYRQRSAADYVKQVLEAEDV